jgi:hypothetical protein|tara:strand:+ start:115 stop:717 length:603 start_codon:yes stop_codon:yes gene_type:complete
MHINRFIKAHVDNMARKGKYEVEIHGPNGMRSRAMRVTAISMPALTLETTQHTPVSAGPPCNYISNVSYGGEVTMTFMLDHTYEDRELMEQWQHEMFDEVWNLTYPEDYHGTVKITQLGVDDLPVYEVELHQAFPTVLGELAFAAESMAEMQTFDTTFKFRTWTSSYENSPSGLLGGLFNKFSRKFKSKAKTKIGSKIFG